MTFEKPKTGAIVRCAIFVVLYLLFLYWVGSWWGLLVVPFIIDAYITKFIPWTWWRKSENRTVRTVMGWVDAIVFALVAVYFINQFFLQNYVIPSSSLEKTLLTGDYLLVSKVSYGPRIPQTPLYMPLTQHTMPLTGSKSYLDKPHWDYRRVKGLGHPQLSDIVVFNYPSGDTVALAAQNQDFYRLAYQIGDQITEGLAATLNDSSSYEEQQSLYRRIYETGRAYIEANPEQFGKVVSRPTDRRENYVKRCVGLPGQTLEIRNNIVYIDGTPLPEPKEAQYVYEVTFKGYLDTELKHELGITDEDMETHLAGTNTYLMPLTANVKAYFESHPDLVESIAPAQPAAEWLYPLNKRTGWTTANYGPIWIPKKGATLPLSLDNLPLYERCIRSYEGHRLEVKNGTIYIDNKPAQNYTFELDYYWMQGDNRDRSADSRFWGFVPEDHIVGKPLFVWLSLDKDYGLFDGKVRWNRLFKWVAKID
ncbi:MAG: S26 family signal peptidase [Bacteroidaceae bacterium]|nr:S26 family signal peptidase [Bacteroidaceae bacterium]